MSLHATHIPQCLLGEIPQLLWVYFPAVLCRLHCHLKTQRDVCHGVHQDFLVLRSIFSDSTKSRFHHKFPIQ